MKTEYEIPYDPKRETPEIYTKTLRIRVRQPQPAEGKPPIPCSYIIL